MNDDAQSLLDPDSVRELLRQMRNCGVDEIEVVAGRSRLFLRRDAGIKPLSLSDQSSTTDAASGSAVPVTAPLTGVLYTRPSPDQPPFAVVGATLESGQVVALIETMKLFNEVATEIAGEVVSVVGEEGSLVEVGQPLLYLQPRQTGVEASRET